MTIEQKDRLKRTFERMAGEKITLDQTPSSIYAYGSELACLRIFAKYQANGASHNPNVRVGKSVNLNAWYCSINLGQ